MSIKVFIERWAKAGKEELVHDMLRDLRSQAVRRRGYMYGETWRSVENPRKFVVISVWGSLEYWQTWLNDPFRQKMDERINHLLRRRSTARVFEDV